MSKNGYVTAREFQTAVNRLDEKVENIDEKVNAMNISFIELRTHFNDNLKKAVNLETSKIKFNLNLKKDVIVAICSGIITLGMALLLKVV